MDGQNTLNTTDEAGFIRFDNYESFQHAVIELLSMPMNFFSGRKSKKELGQLIEAANKTSTHIEKAQTFLRLLRG